MQAEISYDLVMEDEMDFVEGTFRLPDAAWQVFILARYPVKDTEVRATTWSSGVSGVFVKFPEGVCLNKSVVQHLLGDKFSVDRWFEVRGPDSMRLR
jgi:hypothetical protein